MPRLLKTCGDCSCNTRGFTFGKILVAWSRMFPYHLPMTYQFQGSKWGLCEGINIKVFHKTIPHPFLNTIPMISPLWMFFIWSEKERKNIWTYKVPQFSRSNLIVVSAHVIKQTARFPLCFLRCLKEALLLNPSPAASYATWMKSWDTHDDVWDIPIGRCIYYIYILKYSWISIVYIGICFNTYMQINSLNKVLPLMHISWSLSWFLQGTALGKGWQ